MKRNEHSIFNFIGIADCITLAGLIMAIGSIFASLTDHLITAALLILGSAFCDFIDGPVARKLNKTGSFGVAIDGFNDFLTYLVSIVIFAYACGLSSVSAIFCFAIFIASGTLRLSRYSVTGTVDGYYEGIPVSVGILLIPICLLSFYNLMPGIIINIVFAACAFLMVSCIRIKKPNLKLDRVKAGT